MKKVIIISLTIISYLFISCDKGLEPIGKQETDAKLNCKINFINDWPKIDSVEGISIAAFKLPPSESLVQELINGNAILKLNSISYGVSETNVLLDVSETPETFKYIIVAWNYENNIQAQRVIGVYTLTNKSNPDEIVLNPGDSLQIEIEVDWNDFPPQPF